MGRKENAQRINRIVLLIHKETLCSDVHNAYVQGLLTAILYSHKRTMMQNQEFELYLDRYITSSMNNAV